MHGALCPPLERLSSDINARAFMQIIRFNTIIIMKSVINLIRTPQGYSLLEGDNEINKPISKPLKEKSTSAPKSKPVSMQSSHNKISPSTLTYPIDRPITISTYSSLPRRSGSTSTPCTKLRRRRCLSGSRSRRASSRPWYFDANSEQYQVLEA